jgi:hypothetical protein
MARKITNKHGLPDSFMNAFNKDTHPVSGDISVSQLLGPPQVRYLKRIHDIEEDAMDYIFAVFGTALHKWIEAGNSPDFDTTVIEHAADMAKAKYNETGDERYINLVKAIKALAPKVKNKTIFMEQSMAVPFDDIVLYGTSDEIKIIGEGDLFGKRSVISDHKLCSTYAWIYPESRQKWIEQVNVYAWMAEKVGFPPVTELYINAYFRDWSASRLLKGGDYPRHAHLRVQLERMPNDKIESFIKSRLALHRMADNGTPPECDGNDRWATADSYAVKVKSNPKSAVRGSIRDTYEGAERFIKENGHKLKDPYVEVRPGESRKCESYCPVRSVCPQYKKIQEQTREEL